MKTRMASHGVWSREYCIKAALYEVLHCSLQGMTREYCMEPAVLYTVVYQDMNCKPQYIHALHPVYGQGNIVIKAALYEDSQPARYAKRILYAICGLLHRG